MESPRYAAEQVQYWENSALDSRIYLGEPSYSVLPRNPGAAAHGDTVTGDVRGSDTADVAGP